MSVLSPSADDEVSISSGSGSENFTFIEESKSSEEEIAELPKRDLKMEANRFQRESNNKFLHPDHPLMIKYQKELKERLLSLLQESNEQLTELKKTIAAQEDENQHFAVKGYELQKDLKQQEDKLLSLERKLEDKIEAKNGLIKKRDQIKRDFEISEEAWNCNIKKDLEFQTKMEDNAFELVQLTSLKAETFTDAKSLKGAVEKTAKDREDLEVQKLRQDLLISRLENDKFNLEDKINLYKTQWSIKKEEATDLRKELNAATYEIETIQSEKQQIVHHWKQSIVSLERQDKVLGEITDTVRKCEGSVNTLNLDITACKKTVRKEFERNEQLTSQLKFRESDIGRVQKYLTDTLEREKDLEENIYVLGQTVEITEQELALTNEKILYKEKDLEVKERELQKVFGQQKFLEKKHMDMLHEKMTISKTSKYTEKLIKDLRNSIQHTVEKGAQKEHEKEKLLLKLDNMKALFFSMESNLVQLQKERTEKEEVLSKSEANVLKAREKLDTKRAQLRNLQMELREMITEAGGQELGPFEREIYNLKKEIVIAEQGKRSMEKEYLRYQQELFSSSKQNTVKSEENDFQQKKINILEGKKMQLEADIGKEEKDVKDIKNRIQRILSETAQANKILCERKEFQENLLQSSAMTKSDYVNLLKEAELFYLQKQNELKLLRKKKKKHIRKLFEAQRHIVYWEGKIHLAEETRKILKSVNHVDEFASIRSEIRRLQVKDEKIKKEQEELGKELERAVYRHANLYIEADKQALYGKRRKTTEYVRKKIKHAKKKLQEDKKQLGICVQQIEALKVSESQVSDECKREKSASNEMTNKIRALEYSIDNKKKEKRQNVLRLSYEQKRIRFMEKILDHTYIRAVRNKAQRPEEIEKLQSGLWSLQIIAQATINEYSDLEKVLFKVLDYVLVSKNV
ncbi:hypothetical protein JTE90_009491 [Oedothorax gibbosus]|uniref:Coiled-coil domain-containing protein 40 n=1 Tax=Oedothorax gibbosus TaxID=931172 RepID=A0AAV6UVA0_9ARAC|nr:hypothetical protein JTE90_009491 [Oedothorax gibbosus]